jgi:hypothetical protein
MATMAPRSHHERATARIVTKDTDKGKVHIPSTTHPFYQSVEGKSNRLLTHRSGTNFPLFSFMPCNRALSSSNRLTSSACSAFLISRIWNL